MIWTKTRLKGQAPQRMKARHDVHNPIRVSSDKVDDFGQGESSHGVGRKTKSVPVNRRNERRFDLYRRLKLGQIGIYPSPNQNF